MPLSFRRAAPVRTTIKRFIFVVCEHPFFPGEDRMLAQELFRRRWLHDRRLARNECPVQGNVRQTANRAIAHVFGQCDFIRLEDLGSFFHRGSLRPEDVECQVTRLHIDPAHDWVFHRLHARSYLLVSDEVRAVLERCATKPALAAE
jgi:hypothetical protein